MDLSTSLRPSRASAAPTQIPTTPKGISPQSAQVAGHSISSDASKTSSLDKLKGFGENLLVLGKHFSKEMLRAIPVKLGQPLYLTLQNPGSEAKAILNSRKADMCIGRKPIPPASENPHNADFTNIKGKNEYDEDITYETQNYKVKSGDHELDAMKYNNEDECKKDIKDQNFFVMVNGKDSCYEMESPQLKGLSKQLGMNCIGYNASGVMDSGGSAKNKNDVKADLRAVVFDLLARGARPENIHLHGHSLGGSVVLDFVKDYEKEFPKSPLRSASVHNTFTTMGQAISKVLPLPEVVANAAASILNINIDSTKNLKAITQTRIIVAGMTDATATINNKEMKVGDKMIPSSVALNKKMRAM